jgi:hypothetical protein
VITGPDTVVPGGSAQFTATALNSDGSFRIVTNEVSWRSSDESVLSISAGGLATGRNGGETVLQASLDGKIATKGEVLVLPPGTYRLMGTVRESVNSRPLHGARVDVTAGTGQGLTATSQAGVYRLYGVAGDIEVRAVADGYHELRTRLQVTSNAHRELDLNPTGPPANVLGTYTLTVAAAPECRTVLPAEALVRPYRATVAPDRDSITVTLDNSRFFMDFSRTFNRFDGFALPNGATFYLTGPDDFYYTSYGADVLEQLSAATLFAMSGHANVSVSPTGLSGRLQGLIEVVQGTRPGNLQRLASCRSNQHEFVLTR